VTGQNGLERSYWVLFQSNVNYINDKDNIFLVFLAVYYEFSNTMLFLDCFKPLELSNQRVFNNYLEKYPPQTSELTFVNLWEWCMCHPVWIYEHNEVLFILRLGNNKKFYGFMPLGAGPRVKRAHCLFCLMRQFNIECRMERVGEEDAMELSSLGYKVNENPDQFDYVYLQKDLAELSGRKYSRKRNHIKNCLKQYTCEYVPITRDIIPACNGFLEEWCKLRDCAHDPELCCEQRAIRFMLYDYDKYNVIGGAVKVNGEIAAVTFGERLNKDTAVVHFEKAHLEINGLYPLINQWFCQYGLKNFTYINREQDLGSPGLRKAKESYFPEKMIKKFTIVIEGG
jgi:hypothetical protein